MKTTPDEVLFEGKTKVGYRSATDPDEVILESKDDITAGDGARHEILAGKAELSNATAVNVFRLLRACGLPVAFYDQVNPRAFAAPLCEMIPYEVVVRRAAYGSALKRNPQLVKGRLFPHLQVEFFLKTKDKNWKGLALPKDDPLIRFRRDAPAELFLPDKPEWQQQPFAKLDDYPLRDRHTRFQEMSSIARRAFLALEKAWLLQGARLMDFKVEFGFAAREKLLLADVIDADSWRLLGSDGQHFDKQPFREGESGEATLERYRRVKELTDRFALPEQRVVIWFGSVKDDRSDYLNALSRYGPVARFQPQVVVCSGHKEPERALDVLRRISSEHPDSVVIAHAGRSNALAGLLAANSPLPVIAVPATAEKFPEDIWSSLRMPSDVAVMTVLGAENALLAALTILAQRNPGLYARVAGLQDDRLQPSIFN